MKYWKKNILSPSVRVMYGYGLVKLLGDEFKTVEFTLNPRTGSISWNSKKKLDRKIVRGCLGLVDNSFKKTLSILRNVLGVQVSKKDIFRKSYVLADYRGWQVRAGKNFQTSKGSIVKA